MTENERPREFLCGNVQGDAYEAAFQRLSDAGKDIHGEADFVQSLGPHTVLDAGCGTGRVARELARRGVEVVGVDVEAGMLATARRLAPDLQWCHADLAALSLDRTFDLVLLAGNVMIFLQPDTEAAVVTALARHLAPGGLLVAGFQLTFHLSLAEYDRLAARAGLELMERWATWDRVPWQEGGPYAVSVHRRTLSV